MIGSLFPPEVVTITATAQMYEAPLRPEEAAAAAGMTPARRREFTAGRACARQALIELGVAAGPIGRDERGVPEWPQGIVGSISHCQGYCGCAVALTERVGGIGLDVEVAAALPGEVIDEVCSPNELRRGDLPLELLPALWPRLVFSAKECVFKAGFPLTRMELGFQDLTVEPGPGPGVFTASLPPLLAARLGAPGFLTGRYALTAAFLATGVILPPR